MNINLKFKTPFQQLLIVGFISSFGGFISLVGSIIFIETLYRKFHPFKKDKFNAASRISLWFLVGIIALPLALVTQIATIENITGDTNKARAKHSLIEENNALNEANQRYQQALDKREKEEKAKKQKKLEVETARLKAEADKRDKEKIALEKIQAKEIEQEESIYGMQLSAFPGTCDIMITLESGSDNFGIFNTENFEYNLNGKQALVRQRSVYGKNIYGVEMEQRYKCWVSPYSGFGIEHLYTKVK